MRPYLVFVDDDPDELRDLGTIVSEEYEYLPVQWPAKERIQLARMPDIIVLDLYFPTDNSSSTVRTAEREKQRGDALKVAKAFEQLYDDNRDGRELLRDTFECIKKGYALLWEQCRTLGQSPEGGRNLLASIRENRAFDDVPIVFYSRKVTVDEAVRALQAGAFDVIQKVSTSPSGGERSQVLAQLNLARERYKQLVASRLSGKLSRRNITVNMTMFKQEIHAAVAHKIEFTFAKLET